MTTDHLDAPDAARPSPGRRAARPGRHRAAAAAVARGARRAHAHGLPALGPRRAVVAGVGLAATAVGAGLLVPAVTGTADDGPASAVDAVGDTATAVPAGVRLVAGSTLVPTTARAARATGAAPEGRSSAADAGSRGSGAAYDEQTGGREASADPARSGAPERDAGSSPVTGGRGAEPAPGGGTGETVAPSEPGPLAPARAVTDPVTAALPPAVGGTVEASLDLVEDTVAGPLGGVLP